MKLFVCTAISGIIHLLFLMVEGTTEQTQSIIENKVTESVAISFVSAVKSKQVEVTSQVEEIESQFSSGEFKAQPIKQHDLETPKEIPEHLDTEIFQEPDEPLSDKVHNTQELSHVDVDNPVQEIVQEENPLTPDLDSLPERIEKPESIEIADRDQISDDTALANSNSKSELSASVYNSPVQLNSMPALSAPRPPLSYPLRAKRQGQQGVVLIKIELDKFGEVINVSIAQSSGHKMLDSAAIKNVKRWKFNPVLREHEAVPAIFTVPVKFALTS